MNVFQERLVDSAESYPHISTNIVSRISFQRVQTARRMYQFFASINQLLDCVFSQDLMPTICTFTGHNGFMEAHILARLTNTLLACSFNCSS